MEALKFGPFVVPLERAYVALAVLGVLLSAELLARRVRPSLAQWAWNAVLVGLVAARLGYVLAHLEAYRVEPLAVLYFWQGGFSPAVGVLAAAAYTLWFFRGDGRTLRYALLSALIGGLVAASLFSLSARRAAESEVLPAWRLPTPHGGVLDLGQFRGRPLVLNFWASWCPPCRREMPLLLEFARREREVAFVFVNSGENAETVRAYLERSGLDIPNLALDESGRLTRRFRVVALPTTLFFDAEGRLRARHLGELSRAALSDYLKKIRGRAQASGQTR